MAAREKVKSDQVFSLLVTRRTFRLSVLMLAAILAAPLGPTARSAQLSNRRQITLEQSGFFYGEEQYYVVTPPLIQVYYRPSAESDDASEKMPWRPKGMKLQRQGNRGTFLHETFVLVNGKWAKKYKTVSMKPDSYLTANSCDTTNSLDLPGGPLGDVLPHPIKIKLVEDHSDYAVVVYSDTPDRHEYYSLKTALLERDSPSWHVASTIYSGDAMHFCGTKTFHAKSSNGDEPLIFLLYLGDAVSDEPDFISIQSFLLREALPSGQKTLNPPLNSHTR